MSLVNCPAVIALALFAAAAMAEPRAQGDRKIPTLGIFLPGLKSGPGGSPPPIPSRVRDSLARHGFVAGETARFVVVAADLERGTPHDAGERLAGARRSASRIVALKPDVLLAPYGGAELLLELERSIPIVAGSSTPTGWRDHLQSLTWTPTNLTGVTLWYDELALKRIEAVRELLPRAQRFAVVTSSSGSSFFPSALEAAAKQVGLEMIVFAVGATGAEARKTFAEVHKARPDAFLTYGGMPPVPAMEFEATQRIPQIDGGSCPLDPDKAATLCIGEDWDEHLDRFAAIVAEVLKGRRAFDIPFDTTARLSVVVNLKRARQLGIEIPASIMVRADAILQ